MILWQLKEISTGKALTRPQSLPENWGPIFGLENFKDRLGDLSWVGMPDQGWFEVDTETSEAFLTSEEKIHSIQSQIDSILAETADKVMAENTTISKGEQALWIKYRNALGEIWNY
jgi:hypothetical protein